jgi:1-deoxy-D-xylulose-5-phosphate reductoisomerase
MRTPIAYALGWPQRMVAPAPRLRLAEIGDLTFEAPDEQRFPAIRLARQALRRGGSAPTVMNAANEVAVHNFLDGRIDFLDIARIVEETIDSVPNRPLESLEDVTEVDGAARETANSLLSRNAARAPHPA